jgi:trk system potassium uptake protein
MHIRRVFRLIGLLLCFLGLSMSLPLLVSLIYKDSSTRALVFSIMICCPLGLIVFLLSRGEEITHLSHRDGVAIVTLGWLAAGLAGAVPFLLSGAFDNFTDAYFESLSGFTTTGATVLTNIETIPPGILMWRSITQWLGGMGIIVLSIAILPFLGIGGMQLYKAEIPSPVVDKLKPRISDTAKTLWKVYIVITLFQIALLLAGGMSAFDSVCHAFCTMPTGGFSPKNASIAHYNSPYLDGVIIVFMLLAGINFSLHYRLLKGEAAVFGKDPECRLFLSLVGIFILLVTFDIHGRVYASLTEAFRYAAFQVASIITTTGFATADYDRWPSFSRSLLLLCMFLGGMAGSTGGGLKTMRVMLLAKHAYQEIFRIIHPHAVTTVKLGSKVVPGES